MTRHGGWRLSLGFALTFCKGKSAIQERAVLCVVHRLSWRQWEQRVNEPFTFRCAPFSPRLLRDRVRVVQAELSLIEIETIRIYFMHLVGCSPRLTFVRNRSGDVIANAYTLGFALVTTHLTQKKKKCTVVLTKENESNVRRMGDRVLADGIIKRETQR